ncbi:MAG: D-alanine--D-alanine ligase [Chitinispirillales bacterium]|jgi:D-alanine-D-alanine ligase|nr:D-alanine--D-alanine ligase [Chitinispirillales bacterium]
MATKVNVVMGGPSAEYEVSLRSGEQVLSYLDKSKYDLRAVVITKNKQFYYADIAADAPVPDIQHFADANGAFIGPFHPSNSKEIWDNCDAAFLALHGEFGEDGTIQGYLDALGIPYTGSGVYASAVAMNKITSKFLYAQSGMPVPDYSVYGVNHPDVTVDGIIKKHGFPCFLKCPQSGSSRLMGRAADKASLESLLKELQEDADDILVETSISGPEFSCGVIDMPNGETKALPPIEIRPNNAEFFDYTAKYTHGATLELVPAPRPEPLLRQIEETALRAHKALGCYGVSRTDMIYCDSKLYVLETNTLPGMTSASLLPQAFKAQGGTYAGLLDILISSALKRAGVA